MSISLLKICDIFLWPYWNIFKGFELIRDNMDYIQTIIDSSLL